MANYLRDHSCFFSCRVSQSRFGVYINMNTSIQYRGKLYLINIVLRKYSLPSFAARIKSLPAQTPLNESERNLNTIVLHPATHTPRTTRVVQNTVTFHHSTVMSLCKSFSRRPTRATNGARVFPISSIKVSTLKIRRDRLP